MRFNDYQTEAAKTIPANFTEEQMIENAIYGLVGEFGEVVDLLKKAKFQGHELDKEKLILELGDVLWYLAELATGINFNLHNHSTIHKKILLETDIFNEMMIIHEFNTATSFLIWSVCTSIFHKDIYIIKRDGILPIYDILNVVTSLCKKFDTTIEEVASKNIEKLRARYGDKFDSKKSIERTDNA